MTVDNTAYGGSNGSGGRTYDSVEQILARQVAEHEVVTKAADDPASLTDDDLRVLPGEITARLMAAGQLAHLGLGAARRRPAQAMTARKAAAPKRKAAAKVRLPGEPATGPRKLPARADLGLGAVPAPAARRAAARPATPASRKGGTRQQGRS